MFPPSRSPARVVQACGLLSRHSIDGDHWGGITGGGSRATTGRRISLGEFNRIDRVHDDAPPRTRQVFSFAPWNRRPVEKELAPCPARHQEHVAFKRASSMRPTAKPAVAPS